MQVWELMILASIRLSMYLFHSPLAHKVCELEQFVYPAKCVYLRLSPRVAHVFGISHGVDRSRGKPRTKSELSELNSKALT